jgi:zinc/manganese transport system ATP-binding protein
MAGSYLGFGVIPQPVIRLDNVTLRRSGRDLIRDLSGTFAPGSMTAVTGPNGAGKSTLLQAICGLYPTARGRIVREARDIALLAQDGRLNRSFPISCRDAVALGWAARVGLFRRIGRPEYAAADRALDAVGLEGLGQQSIGALSAGQFQRVLFARTMVRDAPVVLLDEPFSAVDATTEDALMAIIRGWHLEGRTIIAVLHDLDLVRAEFPRTLLLGEDRCHWGATEEVLAVRKARHLVAEVERAA